MYKTLTTDAQATATKWGLRQCSKMVKVFVVVYDLSKGVPMPIEINNPVKTVQQITSAEYNVAQINSIAVKHKELRNKSKAPTFALT